MRWSILWVLSVNRRYASSVNMVVKAPILAVCADEAKLTPVRGLRWSEHPIAQFADEDVHFSLVWLLCSVHRHQDQAAGKCLPEYWYDPMTIDFVPFQDVGASATQDESPSTTSKHMWPCLLKCSTIDVQMTKGQWGMMINPSSPGNNIFSGSDSSENEKA